MKKYIGIYILMLLITACGGGGEPGTDGPVVSSDYITVPPSLTLLGDGQTSDLQIRANCNWTISCSASWLTISPSSGSQSQTVSVTAGKNSTGSERVATLTISGGKAPSRTVTVTQPKGTEELRLSASTTSLEFEAKGETKSFTINTNTSWTISKPDWCTVDNASGTGDATISVTVSENKDKEKRTGNIIINGEGVSPVTITINQKEREAGNSEPGSDDNTPPSV